MKSKKIISLLSALTVMTALFSSMLNVSAAITAEEPKLILTPGEYYTVEDEGVTYYMVDIELTYSYSGFVDYKMSGVPIAKPSVTGISAYGIDSEVSNPVFFAAGAYDHTGAYKSESKANWLAPDSASYLTDATNPNKKLTKYTIFTTDPTASTTFSLKDVSISVFEITKGSQTDTKVYENGASIEIPAYKGGEPTPDPEPLPADRTAISKSFEAVVGDYVEITLTDKGTKTYALPSGVKGGSAKVAGMLKYKVNAEDANAPAKGDVFTGLVKNINDAGRSVEILNVTVE